MSTMPRIIVSFGGAFPGGGRVIDASGRVVESIAQLHESWGGAWVRDGWRALFHFTDYTSFFSMPFKYKGIQNGRISDTWLSGGTGVYGHTSCARMAAYGGTVYHAAIWIRFSVGGNEYNSWLRYIQPSAEYSNTLWGNSAHQGPAVDFNPPF